MKIPSKTWQKYIKRLAKINTKAAGDVVTYMINHDVSTYEGTKALIDYAYAVSTKYGEAAAELSCQMYDAIATASKAAVPAAEPAATATYGEIAKTIYGTMASTKNPDAVGAAVGRSVKLASVDTLQQNALRDGAEWAWIPAGDTCPFCLMLASRGWVKASKKAIKNGHADHIHNNCDCTYCVRFDQETTVEDYDPDGLYDQYINAGDTPSERINALRRQHYAANRDYINAQKRAAYARKVNTHKMASNIVLPEGFGSPKPGVKIKKEQLKSFAEKAKQNGVKLDPDTGAFGGFEHYRGDVDILHEMLDDIANSRQYWGERNQSMPVVLKYEAFNNTNDFAKTYNGIISLNKDLFDDSGYMKKLYSFLTNNSSEPGRNWFVKGTNYRSVILHEIGHRLDKYDKLSYKRIRDAIVSNHEDIRGFCLSYLSDYAMISVKGRYSELTSELLSATNSTEAEISEKAKKYIKEAFGS